MSFAVHTRSRSIRPLWPFRINRGSRQAAGLTLWAPMSNVLRIDLVKGRMAAPTGEFVLRPQAVYGYTGAASGDDALDFGTDPIPTSPLSVSAWATLDEGSSQRTIVSKGYDGTNTQFELVNSGAQPRFQSFNGSGQGVAATSSFSSTEFKFVVGTYDGTNYRIYVNGILEDTTAGSAPVATNRALMVGAVDASGFGTVNFWIGKIFDVRIYNRVLSDADVYAMYDPSSRWDLYWQPSRRIYVNAPAAATGGWPVFNETYSPVFGGMVVR